MQIQKWILLSLTTGLFIAPRRSADWLMKWRNYDEEKDNYVDIKNGNFVFNHFKTVKIYGKQIVEIPKGLKVNLNKWFKVNPTDYVLFGGDMKPLTSSQITHKLNDIFKKNISTSMLRHIFLTHKFGNVNLQEIADVAQAMGTSGDEALQYVKR
jgi:integrase